MDTIETTKLTKRFGGVAAVDDLSFSVPVGAVYAIIGPNGAGKTTLINLLSGIYVPTSGQVTVLGRTGRDLGVETLARAGLSRTFQNIQVCMNMDALSNVMIGAHVHLDAGFVAAALGLRRIRRADASLRDRAADLMTFVGLSNEIRLQASQMSYGSLKRLEIARALAADPKILLLDEPAAGLNPTETAGVRDLIEKISSLGVTVVLVEHDMKLVMSVSHRILVLNYGRKLAEGEPGQIGRDPDVIAAYLGAAA
jgi:branched-chain amino acid transport system ATP-binding protein